MRSNLCQSGELAQLLPLAYCPQNAEVGLEYASSKNVFFI